MQDFAAALIREDLRQRVLRLVPAFETLRMVGASLLPAEGSDAARERIRLYLARYARTIVSGKELLVVSGIGEWARRLRELRTEFGWPIASGNTIREMHQEGELFEIDGIDRIRVDDYVLLSDVQDREAAHRWHVANAIRRESGSVKDKLLRYLRANVGRAVSGEELMYVAKGRTEWARRTRELRTEEGWAVMTRNTGRPDLAVGMYVLEHERQAQVHDRHIPDPVRRSVLQRDRFICQDCGWTRAKWQPEDPRSLELHHVIHHAAGGANIESNLVTLCNVCHDERHRLER